MAVEHYALCTVSRLLKMTIYLHLDGARGGVGGGSKSVVGVGGCVGLGLLYLIEVCSWCFLIPR